MRIATWNVNGLRARLDFVQIWLRERQPDLVGLQELKLSDDQFPHVVFEELGYRATVFGQKSWNGVAVLSRQPVETRQRGLPGQQELGARLLSVRGPELDFTTVYCPNGKSRDHPDYRRKLAWFDALAEHLAEASDPARPSVVCGDFNICPSGLDSWDEASLAGSIFHTRDERDRFESLVAAGWIDLYRALHPELQAFSWWDYRGGAFHRGHGLRIDIVLGNAALRPRVVAAEIDRDFRKKHDGLTPSDHAPVYVDLA